MIVVGVSGSQGSKRALHLRTAEALLRHGRLKLVSARLPPSGLWTAVLAHRETHA